MGDNPSRRILSPDHGGGGDHSSRFGGLAAWSGTGRGGARRGRLAVCTGTGGVGWWWQQGAQRQLTSLATCAGTDSGYRHRLWRVTV
jgi:hypothetical protein